MLRTTAIVLLLLWLLTPAITLSNWQPCSCVADIRNHSVVGGFFSNQHQKLDSFCRTTRPRKAQLSKLENTYAIEQLVFSFAEHCQAKLPK